MKKLRIAIIGAGYFGQLHGAVLRDSSQAMVTAVMNRSLPKAQELAEKHNARVCDTFDELFSQDDFEAVSICVPEDCHVEVAVMCAEHKKHILLEKPIATSVAGARKIQQAAQENDVRLMVAHILKFDPRYVQLKDAVRAGRLGELSSIYVRRNGPRTVGARLKGKVSFLHYLAVHDIEWMLDYMNSRPLSVYAQASNKINKSFNGMDTMFAVVRFENGSIGNIETGWAMPDNSPTGLISEVRLVGQLGMGFISSAPDALYMLTPQGASNPDVLHWPYFNGSVQGVLKAEPDHFVHATLTGEPYLVDTESAIAAVSVIDACFASLKSGNPEPIIY